ncbi:MAG: hypothetical protein BZY88_09280 [SAR202 cluster bacterium Io17-Chloro-G9]|nr:MAG: hypothetical protein BZY88_09280 [SAR202 cluster bacterium Io17-Chloro-G9]
MRRGPDKRHVIITPFSETHPSQTKGYQLPVRPVFIVHGIGSQPKGEVLTAVVEPWVQFLGKHLGVDNVRLEAELRPESGPAHATITFGNERWEIWEAHWAQSFHPLKSFRVLTWGFSTLLHHTGSIFQGLIPILRGPGYPDSTQFVYQRRALGVRSKLADKLGGYPAVLLFVPLHILSLVLATAFFLLSQLPVGLFQPRLGAVITKLTEGLVQGPGDMAAILLSETRLASMKHELKDLMLSKAGSASANRPVPERATVIAHSAGATVAFAALSDPSLWETWDRASTGPKEISFLTVGSSLNLAWRSDHNHPIWRRNLDPRVRWIDFWARYDPVPHGPPVMEMQLKARGSDGGVFESVRVVNQDNPFSDHVSYWGNHPEVVSRFVHEIANVPEDAVGPPAELEPSGPPGPVSLGQAVWLALEDIKRHRNWVGTISLLRAYVPAAILGVVTALDFLTPWNTATVLGGPVLEFILPDEGNGGGLGPWLLVNLRSHPIQWLVGFAVIGVALYSLWQIIRLWVVEPKLSQNYPALGRGKNQN